MTILAWFRPWGISQKLKGWRKREDELARENAALRTANTGLRTANTRLRSMVDTADERFREKLSKSGVEHWFTRSLEGGLAAENVALILNNEQMAANHAISLDETVRAKADLWLARELNAALENKIADARLRLDEQIALSRAELAALTTVNDQLREEVSKSEAKNVVLIRNSEQMAADQAILREELAGAKAELASAKQEQWLSRELNASLQQRVSELTHRCEELERQARDFRFEVEGLIAGTENEVERWVQASSDSAVATSQLDASIDDAMQSLRSSEIERPVWRKHGIDKSRADGDARRFATAEL